MLARVLFVVGAVASFLFLADPARGATWVEVKSPHFTVLSDAGERRAREVAWQFEQIRGAIVRLWPWATVEFPLDVHVYAARNEQTMRGLVPEYFEGRNAIRPDSVFVSSPMAHYVALRSDVKLDSRGDINPYRSSYWSYMSLVVRTSFDRDLPPWFSRGLADVFSNTIVRDDVLLVGQLIPWHLERLRSTARIPLQSLLADDAAVKHLRDADRMAEFDAAAWGLVHYLMFGNKGQNLVRMNELSTAIRRGADPNEALARVYGGLQAVNDGMLRYIGQSLYLYQRVPADVNVDMKAFSAREAAAPDVALAFARLHVAMNRPVEARQQLATASAAAAGEVEGALLEREGKRDQARAAYQRASEAQAAGFYGEFRFASLLWPEERAEDADARFAAMEKSLRRAVTLNPRFAPAHGLLAQTLARLGRAAEGLPLAQRSVTLSPTEAYSHESLARVYWALGKREEAIASAKRALAYAENERIRANVQQLLDFYLRPPPSPLDDSGNAFD